MSRDSIWNQHRKACISQGLQEAECLARLQEIDPQTGWNLVCYRSSRTYKLGVYRILERGQVTDPMTGRIVPRLKLGPVSGRDFKDGTDGFWVDESRVIQTQAKGGE